MPSSPKRPWCPRRSCRWCSSAPTSVFWSQQGPSRVHLPHAAPPFPEPDRPGPWRPRPPGPRQPFDPGSPGPCAARVFPLPAHHGQPTPPAHESRDRDCHEPPAPDGASLRTPTVDSAERHETRILMLKRNLLRRELLAAGPRLKGDLMTTVRAILLLAVGLPFGAPAAADELVPFDAQLEGFANLTFNPDGTISNSESAVGHA